MTDITKESFREILEGIAGETGKDMAVGAEEVALYAAERSTHLATLVGDPDFDLALRAERDAIALRAGIVLTREADAADARIVGAIHGALASWARALA